MPSDYISINNTRLPWSREVKYLGLTVDSGLTFKSHINNIKTKFNISRIVTLPLTCRSSPLDIANKLLIYKLFLRPILTYAALSWCTAARTHINTLEILQNKFLRMITNSPWFVRNVQLRRDLNIPSFKEFLINLSKSAWARAERSENPLIRTVVEPQDRPPPRVAVRRPEMIIFDAETD